MGSGTSKYRIDGSDDSVQESESQATPWLAARGTSVGVLTAEAFRLSSVLGRGKFGVVYLSEHLKSAKHFAIKYVDIDRTVQSKQSSRVDQEVQVLKVLDHPFIVHYFGTFNTPESVAMVFEFSFGGELFMRMKQGKKMPEEEAKFYFCEISLCLHYLHDTMNIVYRDLKPENILLDCRGHVKLCDFGFACSTSTYSELNDACGTAMYLAPEIASGHSKSSHSLPVDWWSLGCLLYEMVTGDAPFGDSGSLNKFEILTNINRKTVWYPFLMSGPLKGLIAGMLLRDPVKRSKWGDVKNSEWCSNVSWRRVESSLVLPPWVPRQADRPSTEYFLDFSSLVPQPHAQTKKQTKASSKKYEKNERNDKSENSVRPRKGSTHNSQNRQGPHSGQNNTGRNTINTINTQNSQDTQNTHGTGTHNAHGKNSSEKYSDKHSEKYASGSHTPDSTSKMFRGSFRGILRGDSWSLRRITNQSPQNFPNTPNDQSNKINPSNPNNPNNQNNQSNQNSQGHQSPTSRSSSKLHLKNKPADIQIHAELPLNNSNHGGSSGNNSNNSNNKNNGNNGNNGSNNGNYSSNGNIGDSGGNGGGVAYNGERRRSRQIVKSDRVKESATPPPRRHSLGNTRTGNGLLPDSSALSDDPAPSLLSLDKPGGSEKSQRKRFNTKSPHVSGRVSPIGRGRTHSITPKSSRRRSSTNSST